MAQQAERIGGGIERAVAESPRWTSGWAPRLNSPLGVALLTLVAYGVFTLVRLHSFGDDVSRFVMAGDAFIPARVAARVGLSVKLHSGGYDGQFYYLLALNPFSPHAALPGARFDLPAYRAQRILYPALVWALSLGGRPALVPTLLVLVNLAAIVAVGALGAQLARRAGVAPLWGVVVAFYPGLLLSLARDLSEPLALACALGGLLCALDRRWGWTALLLSLAVLARETTALFALALLVAGLLARLTPLPTVRVPAIRLVAREDWRGATLAGLAPLLVAVGWQVTLLLRWGKFGALAAGSNNLGVPLLGLVEGFVAWSVLWPPLLQLMQYADVAYLLGLAEVTRRMLWRQRRADVLALAWGLYVALTLALSVYVWDYYWNFLRGAIELGIVSLLLLLRASPRLRRVALTATLALWLLTFIASAPLV
ncbi:MAG TPA: hypothetical protein VF812_05665 [Ktedonobacterales bacterium]